MSMSMRDQLAAHALQGILAADFKTWAYSDSATASVDDYADYAYDFADAMLKSRTRKQEKAR